MPPSSETNYKLSKNKQILTASRRESSVTAFPYTIWMYDYREIRGRYVVVGESNSLRVTLRRVADNSPMGLLSVASVY
jgi:hypothetical protein